ncbi:MAG: signal peptidase I, partial [Euryarchaeota archaeon]|nr:signal peptidase I [Euryarchaeota archaeon]
MVELFDQVKEFYQSDNPRAEVLRDVIAVAKILIVFAILSQLVFGMWTPMRAIESGSMEPHMKVGDIVFIQDLSRTSIVTYQEGAADDYKSFGEFGNVILYRKYGRNDETPIIHRAMYYVDAGEPMWERGPPALHAGYITKGDHNPYNDQYLRICTEPIREEWVIGVSRFRVPYAGYVRLAFSRVIQMFKGEQPNA